MGCVHSIVSHTHLGFHPEYFLFGVESRKGSGSFTQCPPPPTDIMLQFWVLLRYYMVIGTHNKGRGEGAENAHALN